MEHFPSIKNNSENVNKHKKWLETFDEIDKFMDSKGKPIDEGIKVLEKVKTRHERGKSVLLLR